MITRDRIDDLRTIITENIRVQRDDESIEYIDVGTALADAKARQNHAIFARRGSGKTLLLHHSAKSLQADRKVVYLNCEDFKQHSFPNVLIEILSAVFRQFDGNLRGWFGRKRVLKENISTIIAKLEDLRNRADEQSRAIVATTADANTQQGSLGLGGELGKMNLSASGKAEQSHSSEVEQRFTDYHNKLKELDEWLPRLKEYVREFFEGSKNVNAVFIQIDDLYHLKRTDQAFVVDYIHRLCKDVPLYFKIATLKHVSVLYVDRDGQPIGAQERHDYQSIDIDYTFKDFNKTKKQNWEILAKFFEKAELNESDMEDFFKGQGFDRLVMAGGGVPRDVLSLFLDMLSETDVIGGEKIGKDEVRTRSRSNFERRIEELKQDSKDNEQDELLRGIYIIRQFCLDARTNVFNVEERLLQSNDTWRALFYRLLDYRIIHNCATALTHKSKEGTYQAFAIDIGCYAHLRKLKDKFKEIDVSEKGAREKMRSAPTLDESRLRDLLISVPDDVETSLLVEE